MGRGDVKKLLILNKALILKDTEYNQILPAYTRRFQIKTRQASGTIRLAFAVGETATKYISIGANSVYFPEDLALSSGLTLYLMGNRNGLIAEIIYGL